LPLPATLVKKGRAGWGRCSSADQKNSPIPVNSIKTRYSSLLLTVSVWWFGRFFIEDEEGFRLVKGRFEEWLGYPSKSRSVCLRRTKENR
jgi:hypothetical protein